MSDVTAQGDGIHMRTVAAGTPWTLVVHGGAGNRAPVQDPKERAVFAAGLSAAWQAGADVLNAGGVAVDAVCAAVQVLEDDPLFNAGRGAALTAGGHAEHDAAVMDGSGTAGAVSGSTHARNPVRAARAVMERTPHVLMTAPSLRRIEEWGLASAEPDYFITDARRQQLEQLLAAPSPGPRHGTVGAVARDHTGHLAAATSTGGIAGQLDGRIGDTPIIGAGTYARDGRAAISCTGEGEAFMRGVLAYDVVARMRYGARTLDTAVTDAITESLTDTGAFGGVIAVDAAGRAVIAYNSSHMFAAFSGDDGLVTLT